MPAVTSSKSVSGTPLETKRGAQWWIAISTRLSFAATVGVSIGSAKNPDAKAQRRKEHQYEFQNWNPSQHCGFKSDVFRVN
jgi:hypothetical protein